MVINSNDEILVGKNSTADELIIEDTDIKWDADDFGNEEISEEEQNRLLEQYEAEIMEREKRKSQVVPLEEKVTLIRFFLSIFVCMKYFVIMTPFHLTASYKCKCQDGWQSSNQERSAKISSCTSKGR